ncbi:MAG: arsenate reductase ArsC [Halothiobacillaceae bacterium]
MEKKRVLVLCTGNSCRSQMGEGWIRHDLGDRVEVFSAGTKPSAVHPLAIAVMAEAGVDISSHRSKSLSEFWGQPFDLVVTVCDSAKEACPMFAGAARQIHESFPDPVGLTGDREKVRAKFREVRDLIRERLVPLVQRELGL